MNRLGNVDYAFFFLFVVQYFVSSPFRDANAISRMDSSVLYLYEQYGSIARSSISLGSLSR
jgi:hypothetical protein